MSSRRAGSALLAATILTAGAACDLGRIELPAQKSAVVIHGVLSPTAPTQSVLIERTLTGEIAAPNVFDVAANEPILTDGGVPESGATVHLITPSGQTIVGIEASSIFCDGVVKPPPCFAVSQFSYGSGHGAGLYLFFLDGSALVAGGRYQLQIVTARKELITAETTIPYALPVAASTTVSYDRDTSLALSWPSTPPSPGYQVRVENLYGAWSSLTDRTDVALSGSIRNVTNENLAHVFMPGFRQALTVSALDANLYDYYRSENSPALGSGIVTRVKGGLGVFGSVVTVARRMLNVVAPFRQPIEGTFDAVLDPALGYIYGPLSITLYVESPAANAGQADAITASCGGSCIGTFHNGQLRLAFLGASVADTTDGLVSELHGDTLIGHYSRGAPSKFVRR